VGHLNKLHEKYAEKGLYVLGICSSPKSAVEDVFINDLGAKYPIAVDSSRKTLGAFGGGGIPHVYVVDSSGRVLGNGHPRDFPVEKLEELLAEAFVPALERELHKSLASAVKSYDKGQVGKAFVAAGKQLEAEDRVLAADAKYLQERCSQFAAHKRKAIDKRIKNREYAIVLDELKSIQKEFAGMELAAYAADTAKKLTSDKKVKLELKAWKAYEKALSMEQKAKGSKGKLEDAAAAYGKVRKKYPDTRAGELANLAERRLKR
jgi:hypothetical protein